ncbi:MAG: hypothetical protein AAB554_05495 [Patescibacteria group bacterium]
MPEAKPQSEDDTYDGAMQLRFRGVFDEMAPPAAPAAPATPARPTPDRDSLIVDLDADPFVPDAFSVLEHKKGGQFAFVPAKITLFLSEGQKGYKRIEGRKLREELKAQPVYNANLLDWYLRKENQHLIPEAWKGKYLYFWGTIYRLPGGRLYVRCLYWHVVGWRWSFYWLDDDWGSHDPAAVPAS